MKNRALTRRQLMKITTGAGLSAGLGLNPLAAQSGPMIMNTIPGTDQALPAIGLGTNRYIVAKPSIAAGFSATLDAFTKLGGTVIDTAPVYRTSEIVLGEWMRKRGNRDQLFIATKVEKLIYDDALQRMNESMVRLQTPVIDLIQSQVTELWHEVKTTKSKQKRKKATTRLKVAEAF